MIPPETCAMPDVIMVISSDRVAPARNGRIVSGASVCPIKMLAATLVDSAPRGSHRPLHHPRHHLDDLLHQPDVVQNGEERQTKMIVGSTANANTDSALAESPSAPNTSDEPSAECPSKPGDERPRPSPEPSGRTST